MHHLCWLQCEILKFLFSDYVNGGEMFTHLYQREHFTESEVRIYIGEIVLALETLHSVSFFHSIYQIVVRHNLVCCFDVPTAEIQSFGTITKRNKERFWAMGTRHIQISINLFPVCIRTFKCAKNSIDKMHGKVGRVVTGEQSIMMTIQSQTWTGKLNGQTKN